MRKTLIAMMGIVCGTVSAEPVYVTDYGFKVENKITTNKSAASVWSALTNNVNDWWPKDHTWWKGTLSIEPQAGGCFCETSGKRSAEHMRIAFVDPDIRLRMTGGLGPLQGMGMYGALDWAITAEDNETTVTLTYTVNGSSPDGYAQLAPIVEKVQGIQLQGLADFLKR